MSHHVSVDESMILFKGWSAIKQYNPMKPIKRGFKLWSLVDMDGYLYHCKVYQGKNQVFVDNSMRKYFGLGPSIAYQLTKPLYVSVASSSVVLWYNVFWYEILTKELENWEDIAKRGIWLLCFQWRISVLQVERQQSCDIAIQFSWNGISNGLTNT